MCQDKQGHMLPSTINGHEAMAALLIDTLHLDTYIEMMELVWIEKDLRRHTKDGFQQKFNRFYGAFLGKNNREMFFEIFQRNRDTEEKVKGSVTFDRIIDAIFEELNGRKSQLVLGPYPSKMLATLNPNKPIMDSRVLQALELPQGKNIDEVKRIYYQIEEWYTWYMGTDDAARNIEIWNNIFSKHEKYRKISDVKKIDFMLWGLGSQT